MTDDVPRRRSTEIKRRIVVVFGVGRSSLRPSRGGVLAER